MTNLRNEAQGEDCEIRTEICNGDPETVVLCHLRMTGISGMSFKASDLLGAHGCSACHEWCDTHGEEGRAALLVGMARTQAKLIERGIVKW
jgi:Protein of unknown function (DUF1364)